MSTEPPPPQIPTILNSDRLGALAACYVVLLTVLGVLSFQEIGALVGLGASLAWGYTFAKENRLSAMGSACFWVCATLLIVAVFVALRPSVTSSELARPTQCRNYMKQIMLALHNYHDAHGSFPPAMVTDSEGRPMHSWRLLILPFLDQHPLYEQYDLTQPWDSPTNIALAAEAPAVYVCPSRSAAEGWSTGLTSYFLVTDDRAADSAAAAVGLASTARRTCGADRSRGVSRL